MLPCYAEPCTRLHSARARSPFPGGGCSGRRGRRHKCLPRSRQNRTLPRTPPTEKHDAGQRRATKGGAPGSEGEGARDTRRKRYRERKKEGEREGARERKAGTTTFPLSRWVWARTGLWPEHAEACPAWEDDAAPPFSPSQLARSALEITMPCTSSCSGSRMKVSQ